MLLFITEKCGGFNYIDENTISFKDLRWARILTVKTDIRKIPRAVRILDGELSFQVVSVVEEDWDESRVPMNQKHSMKAPL